MATEDKRVNGDITSIEIDGDGNTFARIDGVHTTYEGGSMTWYNMDRGEFESKEITPRDFFEGETQKIQGDGRN